MSTMTERAKWLARMVHEGQIRRDGEPYYIHCDEVEEGVKEKGDIVRSVAQMCDVLEDAKNPDLIRLLIKEYFPDEVLFLVETLTHDKNIYYSIYIERICNKPEALAIKLSDMISNTKDIDNPDYPDKQKSKYREACIIIMSKGKEIPKILKERLKIEDKGEENDSKM